MLINFTQQLTLSWKKKNKNNIHECTNVIITSVNKFMPNLNYIFILGRTEYKNLPRDLNQPTKWIMHYCYIYIHTLKKKNVSWTVLLSWNQSDATLPALQKKKKRSINLASPEAMDKSNKKKGMKEYFILKEVQCLQDNIRH